jgi:rubrerythrin
MEFKGSKTMQNLINSFAGESQARNRYTFFAGTAQKEGFEQIAAIFLDTAANESEHAKIYYKHLVKYLGDAVVNVNASYPVVLGDTLTNLKESLNGENEEWTSLYPDSAKAADSEGFSEIAESFRQISEAEKGHENRYKALIMNIESGKVFKKDKPVSWRCRNCGRVITAAGAPEKCPTCEHPKSYFEIMSENY